MPTDAIWSCARTGSVASGSSEPSGSFAVGATTPSQSSRLAVAPVGSVPPTGAAKTAGAMGAIEALSHASAGTGSASSASRSA